MLCCFHDGICMLLLRPDPAGSRNTSWKRESWHVMSLHRHPIPPDGSPEADPMTCTRYFCAPHTNPRRVQDESCAVIPPVCQSPAFNCSTPMPRLMAGRSASQQLAHPRVRRPGLWHGGAAYWPRTDPPPHAPFAGPIPGRVLQIHFPPL